MSYERDDVFAEPPCVTPQQQEYAIQRRLEAAQRLADALNRLAASHKDFLWCASQTPPRVPDLEWSQEIEDAARAALAEWEATK